MVYQLSPPPFITYRRKLAPKLLKQLFTDIMRWKLNHPPALKIKIQVEIKKTTMPYNVHMINSSKDKFTGSNKGACANKFPMVQKRPIAPLRIIIDSSLNPSAAVNTR